MNKIIFLLLILTFSLVSCATTKQEPEIKLDSQESEIKHPEDIIQEDDEVELIEEILSENDEEYLRSTDNLADGESVTKKEFEQDKFDVLKRIEELSEIMEKEDFDAWLEFISPDSIAYWSNIQNIRKAQTKLPNQSIKLRGLSDYFKYIFIPSRKRSKVDEIRYISKTNIKAVEVKPDFSTVVYYYFVKEKGKWLIHLPTL